MLKQGGLDPNEGPLAGMSLGEWLICWKKSIIVPVKLVISFKMAKPDNTDSVSLRRGRIVLFGSEMLPRHYLFMTWNQ